MASNDYYNDTRHQGRQQWSGDDDFSSAASHAEQHADQDRSLFSSALSFLSDRKSQLSDPSQVEVDEDHAMRAHNAMYNDQDDRGSRHDSSTVGAGAAMQALKMFTSGGSNDGGMDKNKLIGLAMAQAGQLWDQKQSNGAQMVSCISRSSSSSPPFSLSPPIPSVLDSEIQVQSG